MGKPLSPVEIRLYRLCDEALFYVWDPIGVRDDAFARTQYERYLPRVFELLKANAREEIIRYLCDVAHERMGLDRLEAKAAETADFLFAGQRWIEMTVDAR